MCFPPWEPQNSRLSVIHAKPACSLPPRATGRAAGCHRGSGPPPGPGPAPLVGAGSPAEIYGCLAWVRTPWPRPAKAGFYNKPHTRNDFRKALKQLRFSSSCARERPPPGCRCKPGAQGSRPGMKMQGAEGRGCRQGCQKLYSTRYVDASHPAPLRQPYQVKSKDIASACNCVRMAWMNWITLWKAVQTRGSVTHAYRKQIITLCAPGDNWGWPEAFSCR